MQPHALGKKWWWISFEQNLETKIYLGLVSSPFLVLQFQMEVGGNMEAMALKPAVLSFEKVFCSRQSQGKVLSWKGIHSCALVGEDSRKRSFITRDIELWNLVHFKMIVVAKLFWSGFLAYTRTSLKEATVHLLFAGSQPWSQLYERRKGREFCTAVRTWNWEPGLLDYFLSLPLTCSVLMGKFPMPQFSHL